MCVRSHVMENLVYHAKKLEFYADSIEMSWKSFKQGNENIEFAL